MKYIVKDWYGNRLFPDKEFDESFEAWSYLYKYAPDPRDEEMFRTYDDYIVEEIAE